MAYKLVDDVIETCGVLTPTEKLTLIAIAKHAKKGETTAWPSNERLALLTGIHQITISKTLTALAKKGFITREKDPKTKNATGRILAINSDRLTPEEVSPGLRSSPPESGGGGKRTAKEGLAYGKGGVSVRLTKPVKNQERTSQTKNTSPPAGGKRATRSDPLEGFEEWWKLYPRGEEKKAAKEVWKRKKLSQHKQAIMDDTRARVARGQNPKFMPYGRRYLSNERWKDEHNPATEENRDDRRPRPETGRPLSAPERVKIAGRQWLIDRGIDPDDDTPDDYINADYEVIDPGRH
jgi:hypothetical protein